MAQHRGTCRHCHKARWIRLGGLCCSCALHNEIRAKYGVPLLKETYGDDPTEAELDALIKERLPTMPDFEAEPAEERESFAWWRIVRVSPRGRRVMRRSRRAG